MIFKVGFLLVGNTRKHSSIPQQVVGGHLDFDTENVDVMLLRCFLASPPTTQYCSGLFAVVGEKTGPSLYI